MNATIRIEIDEDNTGREFWLATAEWDGSPEYDASGPDPLYAVTRLAELLLQKWHESRDGGPRDAD